MNRFGSKDPFFRELDRREIEGRNQRIFANRPENLHDYQGCAKSENTATIPHEEPLLLIYCECGSQYSLHTCSVCPHCFRWPPKVPFHAECGSYHPEGQCPAGAPPQQEKEAQHD